jgi:hypothetical protein
MQTRASIRWLGLPLCVLALACAQGTMSDPFGPTLAAEDEGGSSDGDPDPEPSPDDDDDDDDASPTDPIDEPAEDCAPGHAGCVCGPHETCKSGATCEAGLCVPCMDDACAICGNAFCEVVEDCSSCPIDCGGCDACGNATCDLAQGEACGNCPDDCDACEGCGDETCGPNEDCFSCAADCSACAPSCGDGICNGAEDCVICVADCGACAPSCGDGSCNRAESCASCPGDCGACGPVCGDDTCNGTETCLSCATDCGNVTCTNAFGEPVCAGDIGYRQCPMYPEGVQQCTCSASGTWVSCQAGCLI